MVQSIPHSLSEEKPIVLEPNDPLIDLLAIIALRVLQERAKEITQPPSIKKEAA